MLSLGHIFSQPRNLDWHYLFFVYTHILIEGLGGFGEPLGFDEEGGVEGGAVEGTGELGAAVALEGYIGDDLGEEDLVVVVEDLEGDVHGLDVGVEEEVAVDGCGLSCGGGGVVDDGEAGIGGGEAGGGVEALTACTEGGADLGGLGGTGVGGDDTEPGDDAGEGDVEVLGHCRGHGDRLGGAEGFADLLGGVGGLSGTGEGEGVALLVVPTDDYELVGAERQGAGEVAESGIGAGIVAVLGTLIDGSGTGIDSEGEQLEVVIVGDTGGSGRCSCREGLERRSEVGDADGYLGGGLRASGVGGVSGTTG